MSVRVTSEVFRHSQAELGARLVLLALADPAHDDGVTWIDQVTLAAKTRLQDSTVRECLKRLAKLGEVEVRKAQRGRRRINVYRVIVGSISHADVDYDRLPFELDRPFSRPPESGGGHDDDGRRSTDVTAADPLADSAPRPLNSSEASTEPLEDPPRRPPQGRHVSRPVTVDRKRVTDDEFEVACDVLAAFNEVAGTRYASKEWVAKIVMRLREHPAVTVAQHRAIIAAAFARPWWTGDPSPSVVYGNGALFERTALGAEAAIREVAEVGEMFDRMRARQRQQA